MQATPQPFPLGSLAAMADKQTLACVQGTVERVWKAKSGENSTGTWSIQNVDIIGDNGIKVTLWLKDRDAVPESAKGQIITAVAKTTDKGLSGVYVMDDIYKATTTRKIKVTPSAEILIGNPAPQQQQQQQPPPQQQQQQANQKQQQNRQDGGDLRKARQTIMQIANLHLLCARCVAGYEAKAYQEATGEPMTEAARQAATSSIFIESCRNGLHRDMPVGKIED